MNDFEGLLPSDYGFKPSNKPISGSRSTRPASNSFSVGGGGGDADSIFGSRSNDLDDVLGGSARHGAKSPPFGLDSVYDKRNISEPVYDKPVYDDDGGAGVGDGDIFDGVPGIRSSSSSSKVKYEDVFTSSSSSPPRGVGGRNDSAFEDLLGGFGKTEPPRWKSDGGANRPEKSEKSNASDFDDLLPGFGVRVTSPPTERSAPDANKAPETFANASKTTSKVAEDPFISTGQFSDPLEEISRISNSRSTKFSSVGNGGSFDDVDPFEGLMKTTTTFSSERENRVKEASTLRTESNTSGTKNFATREMQEKPSVRSPDSQSERKVSAENDWDSRKTFFEMPTASNDTYKSYGQTRSPPSYDAASASFKDSNAQADRSPSSEENMDSTDDIWLSVSEVPLFTQPTSAPPPSRPPPPRPVSKAGLSKGSSSNARRKNEYSSFPNPSQSFQVPNSSMASGRASVVSPIDELEDLASGRNQDKVDEHANGVSGEEMEMNSVAAAMKEAMDRAQAKFRQAKEVRERENTKVFRSKEGPSEREERLSQDERAREKLDRLERQRQQREREEQEAEQEKLERARERENEREREERERDQRRLEKEKERFRVERERANRQAVERATREARERAAFEAKQRVERAKAERAAVDKATSEARERAERAAVLRAQSEARERAAADAKERAERAAAESRERANSELKEKEARERAAAVRAEAEARTRAAERAAVGRAASEARERAAVDARDRAAAAARANLQKNDDDLESFFSSRASSAPKPRTTKEPFFDAPSQSKSEVPRAPTGNSSNIKKASSATNIVDDFSSIFNAGPSSGGFQDVEGETDERRRARLERHQRTQERASKALEEKNQRDLQNQREQAERSRIGETLDVEIKRWAAGKEGNLRALLSTMQYVLWPESGWQAVSLTDMITAASVKKVYRKATLCIHPDKVQQKGATLQQKYVAEKVFDLLKEAWNKFNSEELF